MKTKISLAEMPDNDTILLYGLPKRGKTFAYCSIIERCIEAGGNVFVINTDSGLKRTAQAYFGDKFDTVAKSIQYYLITNIDDVTEIIADVKGSAKPNDLIVVDLLTDFYEMAQEKFVDNLSGGNIIDYYERASRDKQKFGVLSGQQWQYIKKLDNYVINELVIRPPCRVVAVASARELEMDKVHKNTEVLDEYEAIGHKPDGQKRLQYKFSSIVYIGELKGSKYMIVLGDRGKKCEYKRLSFGRDFWQKFMEFRKK
ncbi:AAA family ATPase [Thermoproteota archaeon]